MELIWLIVLMEHKKRIDYLQQKKIIEILSYFSVIWKINLIFKLNKLFNCKIINWKFGFKSNSCYFGENFFCFNNNLKFKIKDLYLYIYIYILFILKGNFTATYILNGSKILKYY
jgi:hypothetical protein